MLRIRSEQLDSFGASASGAPGVLLSEHLRAQGILVEQGAASDELQLRESNGRRSRLVLNSDGQPSVFATPADNQYRFRRSDNGRAVQLMYPGEIEVLVARDEQGRVSAIDRPGHCRYYFDHDAEGRLIHVGYPGSRRYQLTYGPASALSELTDRCGQTTRYGRRSDGVLKCIEDARGRRTEVNSDFRGALRSVCYSDGSTERFAFDPDANVAVFGQRDGNEVLHELDDRGRLSSIQWSDDTWQGFLFGDGGELAAIDNQECRVAFDLGAGAGSTIERGPHGSVEFTHGQHEELTSLQSPLGRRYHFEYDPDRE